RNVSMVYQQFINYPHMTVYENIASPLRVIGVDDAKIKERVGKVAELLRLVPMLQRKPAELSGGQQQRTAIARALVKDSELILLDEPLANLDRRRREAMREELARIQRAVGVTIVLVTHDQEEALSLATRIGVMNEGRLEQVGSPTTLWRRPATRFVARFLGEMNLVPARLDAAGTAVLDGLGERVPVAGGAPPGDLVACLRPEALAIARPGAADPGQSADPDRSAAPGGPGAAGRVGTVAYAGGSVTYRVVLDSGLSLLVREALADGVPGFRPGDPVAVSTRNVPCTLLPS
ncbi:MAG TPA: ABC transporter ATP-binding protein, partial [Micromonospora sp.]